MTEKFDSWMDLSDAMIGFVTLAISKDPQDRDKFQHLEKKLANSTAAMTTSGIRSTLLEQALEVNSSLLLKALPEVGEPIACFHTAMWSKFKKNPNWDSLVLAIQKGFTLTDEEALEIMGFAPVHKGLQEVWETHIFQERFRLTGDERNVLPKNSGPANIDIYTLLNVKSFDLGLATIRGQVALYPKQSSEFMDKFIRDRQWNVICLLHHLGVRPNEARNQKINFIHEAAMGGSTPHEKMELFAQLKTLQGAIENLRHITRGSRSSHTET